MTTIKIKKGAGTPSGLTFGELAYDVTNKKLFIGITGGNALLANTDGGVASFNGITGAVTGVTVGGTNVFTALNSFTAGLSASGGMTLAGSFQGSTATFTNGNVIINKSSGFGITASNIFSVGSKAYSFSRYTASSALTNQTIAIIPTGFQGAYTIDVQFAEGTGFLSYSNSNFVVTMSGYSAINWTETTVYNTVNKPNYSFVATPGVGLELKVTQSVLKFSNVYYIISAEGSS